MDKIIIEARVNELAPRHDNPNVPFLPDEIIRDACPILIHPTLGYLAHVGDARERFDAVEESMKDPKTAPHFAPTDTGSVNVDW